MFFLNIAPSDAPFSGDNNPLMSSSRRTVRLSVRQTKDHLTKCRTGDEALVEPLVFDVG
jgi:hypothetical protein